MLKNLNVNVDQVNQQELQNVLAAEKKVILTMKVMIKFIVIANNILKLEDVNVGIIHYSICAHVLQLKKLKRMLKNVIVL